MQPIDLPLSQRMAMLDSLSLPSETKVVPGVRIDNLSDIPADLEKLKARNPIDGIALFAVRSPKLHRPLLFVGLNTEGVEALSREWNNAARAYAAFGRYISDYGELALGLRFELFEDDLDEYKERAGTFRDADLSGDDWRRLSERFMAIIAEETGEPFDQNPASQISRLLSGRRFRNDAVYLQIMLRSKDGLRVGSVTTRDKHSGEAVEKTQFRQTAGSGIVRDDVDLDDKIKTALLRASRIAEKGFTHPQELRFAVANGDLWLTGCQPLDISAPSAAVRLAVDLANEKIISQDQALLRIDPMMLDAFLHDRLDPSAKYEPLTRGVPASPGAVSGRLVFSSEEAEAAAAKGEKVLLVCPETTPSEVFAMQVAAGILTSRGGPASHAATVARGLGRPCVVGASDLRIDTQNRKLLLRDRTFTSTDVLTIDGRTGSVLDGDVPTLQPELNKELKTLLTWADEKRDLKVLVNADTVEDCKAAFAFGAEGVGLCRTEHMFFDSERIVSMREMILAHSEEARRSATDKILPMQQADFEDLFRIAEGRPLVIRLLDPPLHEFLPSSDEDFEQVAKALDMPVERLKLRAARMTESNPMLGHRGCRLGLTYPEIYEMQAKAIMNAAEIVVAEGIKVDPQIMIPLVAWPEELERLRMRLEGWIGSRSLKAKIGTMIELPRAALLADQIAENSDFFSFGTNDLTQTTFGISRDDAASFLKSYEQAGLITADPFRSLDRSGVGSLISQAVEMGRGVNGSLELGICGEHGGDPESIRFCQSLGLEYVSCSPFRVPIARLAAAQAVLAQNT